MAIFRKRCSDRCKLVAAVGITGLVILIVQRYGLAPQGLHTNHDKLRKLQKIKELREMAFWVMNGGKENKLAAGGGGGAGNGTRLEVKTVLMHSFPYYYELKSGPRVFTSCRHPCTLTLDAELVEEVDSVVLFSHNFKASGSLPGQRSARQVWVFFAVESPVNSRNKVFQNPQWRGVFNWTMTYRRDSDFYFGYGDIVKAPETPAVPKRDLSTVVAGKSKHVAWFVSNCHTQSKREDFAEALKAFIRVDVFGKCGSLNCGKEGDRGCMDMLSKDYYFYLALENSLCDDYLTEKVYRTMKSVDVVPVVRGGANYTRLLPSNSFIDASKFPSVRALADHLKKVASDRQLYHSYLAWKHEYRVIEPVPFSFCQFCERLHDKERWARVYRDVDAWWVDGRCRAPPAVVKS